ncbi:MAG: AAA family ATPase [Candidatus Limnocylindrales bacterium]
MPRRGHRSTDHTDVPNTSALLAVVVDAPANEEHSTLNGEAGRDRAVRLVRAFLSGARGRDVAGPFGDACLVYSEWGDAVAAATGLGSQLRRLEPEFGVVFARCGLDLIQGESERTVARQVTQIARTGAAGQIRLGGSLGAIVDRDPPDRLAVRAVDSATPGRSSFVSIVAARDVIPHGLVESGTSFVGRDDEIRRVRESIERGQLTTIVGPPGIGKSRLAGEVAERILGRFPDGAWFIALANVSDSKLVSASIAADLGVPVGPGIGAADAVAAHIKDRRVLLVLDNMEQVLDASSELVRLLESAPGLRILATSRTRLGVAGEQRIDLAPLAIGGRGGGSAGPSSDAIRLFCDRAATPLPSFQAGPDELELIGEICRRLDGMPLAIELAAARVRLLSLAALLERLDARLGMQSDRPDASIRQRSLRTAIAWSHDLLDPASRVLFRRLSVFRAGWDIAAAVEVCGDDRLSEEMVLRGLTILQDASLLVPVESSDGERRLTMLETIRQFAGEQLAGDDEPQGIRRRHAAWALGLATRLGPRLTGPEQAAALDRLAQEHDNVRTALAELLERDPVNAVRLASRIWRFWQMRGHLGEGAHWLKVALEQAANRLPSDVEADGRAAAGGIAYWLGDLAETERHYTRAVELRRSIGAELLLADALFDLAFVYDPALRPPPEDPERSATGIRVAEEAYALYRAIDHLPGIAKSEWLLGSVVAHRDLARATTLLASSVDGFRALDDPFGLGWALHSYGLALLGTGDSDSAFRAFSEALGLFASASDGSATGLLLDDIAEVARAEGDTLRTARLKGAAAAMRQSAEVELVVANAPWLVDDPLPRGLIDPAAIEQAWSDGRTMRPAEAIAYALRDDASTIGPDGMRVSALGPLIVERFGTRVTDWGGLKAGGRHALAIFAFLLDRGEQGVTKDEFVEVVWPDADVDQGDLNFHRTLAGLRATLAGQASTRSRGEVVFAGGRYRLAGRVVAWLDASEFQRLLSNAAEASDEMAAIRGLEAARRLYRGDYLDDCPFFGDSTYVEERRAFLRGRFVDALVELGRRYAARHDDSLASERFREALSVSGGDCPSASDGLKQLGLAALKQPNALP